jgi:hypothetical protein
VCDSQITFGYWLGIEEMQIMGMEETYTSCFDNIEIHSKTALKIERWR